MEVVNFSEVFLRQHGGQDHWIFPSFVTSEAKHSTIDATVQEGALGLAACRQFAPLLKLFLPLHQSPHKATLIL
jgi:hypothetical protein